MADDLWPDNIAESDLVTPVSILKEQAALLGEKTKQLVKGEVDTTSNGNLLVHNFYIVAPTLNYRYQLFSINHTVSFYPLNVRHLANQPVQVHTEAEFKEMLKQIFASQHTMNVVHSILAQVRS